MVGRPGGRCATGASGDRTAQVTVIFAQYQTAAAAGAVPDDLARRMDGALLSIGALSGILKAKVRL